MECRRSNQLILKEINPEYSLEGLMLRLKLQYFGHLMRRADLWRPWCWTRLRAGGEGATEDEMVGWHHWLSGHEFEQTLGDGEGRGSLACCSPWGHKELDMTEWTTATITSVFYVRGRQKGQNQWERSEVTTLWALKREHQTHAEECRQPLEALRDKELSPPLEPARQRCWRLHFSRVTFISDSSPPEL